MAKKEISYSDALSELETIVQKMENDEVDIDELSNLTERANKLIDLCRNKLRGVEDALNENLKD